MADESKSNFETVFNKKEGVGQEEQRNKDSLFDEIRQSLRLDKNRPADKQAATRMLDTFIESLQKNNSDLLVDLADSDKKLLEQTIDEISKLQNKTLDEFKKSLASINKLAEELSRRGENTSSQQLKDLGEKLKESTLQERFKAEGLTLEGKDDTFVNRLKQEFFGNSKEPGREGTPTRGFKEGFKNFGSEFMGGFKQSLMPRGGFVDRLTSTQESRRENIRNETNRANAYNSEVSNILEKVKEVIRGKKEDAAKPNEEQTDGTQAASNAPDIENTTKVVDGKTISENANESAQNIEGATKSASQEQKAGITDADASYSRSSTQNSTKEQDRWDELIDLIKQIRDCVCECQCGPDAQPSPTPTPSPTTPRVTNTEPTSVPTTTPESTGTGIGTGVKVALGAAAAGATALLTRKPQLAARVGKLFSTIGKRGVTRAAPKPLALPAPARMAANGERLALPAPSMGNRSGVTLEELGMKTATREKVPVSRATPNSPAEKTISQRFYNNEITAREAAQQMRTQNRTNVTNNTNARNLTNNTNATNLTNTTNNTTQGRASPTGRWSSNIPKSEYFNRIKANQSQEQLARAVGAQSPKSATPATNPGMMTKVKDFFGIGKSTAPSTSSPKVAPKAGTVSKLGRVGGKFLGPLGAALDFGSRKAAGQGTAKAAIGTGGGLAGAAAGAVVGQALIPIPILGALIGGVVGGLGGGAIADKATDLAGMRESGGPVSAKGSYIVGEKGPEIFTPNTAGSITNNMNTKSLVETGQNNISSSIDQITNESKENTAPIINVPPPTIIPQPIPAGGGGNIASSLHADTVRTEDSSWQRFQNRRAFG